MYPELAKIAKKHGYALAVHGSLQRDFDLIAIPWVYTPSPPKKVMDEIVSKFYLKVIGAPTEKFHGRMAHTLSIGWGECAIDLSFMPLIE